MPTKPTPAAIRAALLVRPDLNTTFADPRSESNRVDALDMVATLIDKGLEGERKELLTSLESFAARAGGLSVPPGDADFLRARFSALAFDIRAVLFKYQA